VLPRQLHGPALTIRFASPGTVNAFLRDNKDRYSNLDPDFILQICFEHPDQFNELFPAFDPNEHSAVRVERNLGWVYDNVRYDHNEELDFWYEQFDTFRRTARSGYEIFDHMMQSGTWPFPPVIIEAQFAVSLGAPQDIGKPYHLIEGTHRVSYARRMIEIGLADRARTVEVIELAAG
jgi:hypothetical protein